MSCERVSLKRDRILVVDDREASRYMVSRVLKKAGYEVMEAENGEEALRIAATLPALVILDINLPDMSGIEVCRRIKADPETASVLVVHLSASFVSAEDRVHGLSVGADGYLTHPVDPNVLTATVRAFLRIRRAEEDLRRAKTELEATVALRNADIESLKMERELREKFVFTLTHDLRSPLAAARISAEMLVRGKGNEEMRGRAAQRVISNIDRTDRMIQDLLDANRIRAGQPLPITVEECDLRDVAQDVVTDLEGIYGKRLELRICARGDGEVRGFWGSDELRRVLENLLHNAFKYGSQEEPVRVDVDGIASGVEIRVHNKGNPIPPEEQVLLFEQFRRSKAAVTNGKQGWGLGLTLVRGIVEAHGGAVRVSSGPSIGTTFTVNLPWDSRAHSDAGSAS